MKARRRQRHAWNSPCYDKDVFCRYKTKRVSGKKKSRLGHPWSSSRLGVAGITKDAIKALALKNTSAVNAVMRYTDVWIKLTHQMGYW